MLSHLIPTSMALIRVFCITIAVDRKICMYTLREGAGGNPTTYSLHSRDQRCMQEIE